MSRHSFVLVVSLPWIGCCGSPSRLIQDAIWSFDPIWPHTGPPPILTRLEKLADALAGYQMQLALRKYINNRPALLECDSVRICEGLFCISARPGQEEEDFVGVNKFHPYASPANVSTGRPWVGRIGMDTMQAKVGFNGSWSPEVEAQVDPGSSISTMDTWMFKQMGIREPTEARLVCTRVGEQYRQFALLYGNITFLLDGVEHVGDLMIIDKDLTFMIGWQLLQYVPIAYLRDDFVIGSSARSPAMEPLFEIPYGNKSFDTNSYTCYQSGCIPFQFAKPPSIVANFPGERGGTVHVEMILDPQSCCTHLPIANLPLLNMSVTINGRPPVAQEAGLDIVAVGPMRNRTLKSAGVTPIHIHEFSLATTSFTTAGNGALKLWGCIRRKNPEEHGLFGVDFFSHFDVVYDPDTRKVKMYKVGDFSHVAWKRVQDQTDEGELSCTLASFSSLSIAKAMMEALSCIRRCFYS